MGRIVTFFRRTKTEKSLGRPITVKSKTTTAASKQWGSKMKTKCYSVRLKSLELISDKAYKAEAFDGSSDIIPASQVFGPDHEVSKSEAWWISAWILEKKSIQYSTKKSAWFEQDGNMPPVRLENSSVTVSHHTPGKIAARPEHEIQELKRG